jgi:hypothetical protein
MFMILGFGFIFVLFFFFLFLLLYNIIFSLLNPLTLIVCARCIRSPNQGICRDHILVWIHRTWSFSVGSSRRPGFNVTPAHGKHGPDKPTSCNIKPGWNYHSCNKIPRFFDMASVLVLFLCGRQEFENRPETGSIVTAISTLRGSDWLDRLGGMWRRRFVEGALAHGACLNSAQKRLRRIYKARSIHTMTLPLKGVGRGWLWSGSLPVSSICIIVTLSNAAWPRKVEVSSASGCGGLKKYELYSQPPCTTITIHNNLRADLLL